MDRAAWRALRIAERLEAEAERGWPVPGPGWGGGQSSPVILTRDLHLGDTGCPAL